MKPLRAVLVCSQGCPGEHELDAQLYRCPQCQDLLEVRHDLEALRERTPEEWKQLFTARLTDLGSVQGSGVWGKKEWVHPNLREENLISFREGNTPLVPARRLAASLGLSQVLVKQCGHSHTGSFKDLGMTVLVSQVRQIIQSGKPMQAVICASTGDTSAALAAYCAAAGVPAVVLLPADKVSPAQLIQPLANGALTLALDTDFDGCMRLVQQLSTHPQLYLANSMNALRLEGQKTVAMEIVQQLHWEVPDWVILPGGNLGNVSAVGQGLLLMRALGLIERLPRLVCAQAEHANPLYESYRNGFRTFHPVTARPTLASAIQIGDPVSSRKAIRVLQALAGRVEQASEPELAEAAARADHDGMFCCPQTGVALAALCKLAAQGEIRKHDRVVVISTANGLKFVDFKIGYHQGTLPGLTARLAKQVHAMPADLQQVEARILQFARASAA